MPDNNGKWQIAVWVMGIIVSVILVGVVNGMVTNDRMRASEDQRIEQGHKQDFNGLKDFLNNKFDGINQRLTRIETKVEQIK